MNRREFVSTIGSAALAAAIPAAAQESEPPLEHRLPATDLDYQRSKSYIEEVPVHQYHWASQKAIEAFNDLKFGLRIHWGIYSVFGQPHESWPFLSMSFDERQKYNDTYKTWNPHEFDADAWMNLCQEAELKMFAFTTKHHEGFSMFNTKTRVRNRANWTAPGGPRIEDCDLRLQHHGNAISQGCGRRAHRRSTQAQHQDRSLFFPLRLVRRGFPAVWMASSAGSVFTETLGFARI